MMDEAMAAAGGGDDEGESVVARGAEAVIESWGMKMAASRMASDERTTTTKRDEVVRGSGDAVMQEPALVLRVSSLRRGRSVRLYVGLGRKLQQILQVEMFVWRSGGTMEGKLLG